MISILSAQKVLYFPLVVKWQGILPTFMTIWAFFPRNGYISRKLISSGIATTTFHQYNHTGKLYFGYNLKITEKSKYVIFRKVKQSKSVITTWKLPSSKVYHGLNNALGVPICENLGYGPWTILYKSIWGSLWAGNGGRELIDNHGFGISVCPIKCSSRNRHKNLCDRQRASPRTFYRPWCNEDGNILINAIHILIELVATELLWIVFKFPTMILRGVSGIVTVVLAVFRAEDKPLAPCILVHVLANLFLISWSVNHENKG